MEVRKKNGLVSIQMDDGRVVEVPFKHRDARRTIWEGPDGEGVVQYFQIHVSNMPLARHYHRLTTETFTILNGGGCVLTSAVNRDGIPIDAEGNLLPETDAVVIRRQLKPMDVLEIVPFLAHTWHTPFICNQAQKWCASHLIRSILTMCWLPHGW